MVISTDWCQEFLTHEELPKEWTIETRESATANPDLAEAVVNMVPNVRYFWRRRTCELLDEHPYVHLIKIYIEREKKLDELLQQNRFEYFSASLLTRYNSINDLYLDLYWPDQFWSIVKNYKNFQFASSDQDVVKDSIKYFRGLIDSSWKVRKSRTDLPLSIGPILDDKIVQQKKCALRVSSEHLTELKNSLGPEFISYCIKNDGLSIPDISRHQLSLNKVRNNISDNNKKQDFVLEKNIFSYRGSLIDSRNPKKCPNLLKTIANSLRKVVNGNLLGTEDDNINYVSSEKYNERFNNDIYQRTDKNLKSKNDFTTNNKNCESTDLANETDLQQKVIKKIVSDGFLLYILPLLCKEERLRFNKKQSTPSADDTAKYLPPRYLLSSELMDIVNIHLPYLQYASRLCQYSTYGDYGCNESTVVFASENDKTFKKNSLLNTQTRHKSVLFSNSILKTRNSINHDYNLDETEISAKSNIQSLDDENLSIGKTVPNISRKTSQTEKAYILEQFVSDQSVHESYIPYNSELNSRDFVTAILSSLKNNNCSFLPSHSINILEFNQLEKVIRKSLKNRFRYNLTFFADRTNSKSKVKESRKSNITQKKSNSFNSSNKINIKNISKICHKKNQMSLVSRKKIVEIQNEQRVTKRNLNLSSLYNKYFKYGEKNLNFIDITSYKKINQKFTTLLQDINKPSVQLKQNFLKTINKLTNSKKQENLRYNKYHKVQRISVNNTKSDNIKTLVSQKRKTIFENIINTRTKDNIKEIYFANEEKIPLEIFKTLVEITNRSETNNISKPINCLTDNTVTKCIIPRYPALPTTWAIHALEQICIDLARDSFLPEHLQKTLAVMQIWPLIDERDYITARAVHRVLLQYIEVLKESNPATAAPMLLRILRGKILDVHIKKLSMKPILCSEICGKLATLRCNKCNDFFSLQGYLEVHNTEALKKHHVAVPVPQLLQYNFPHNPVEVVVAGLNLTELEYIMLISNVPAFSLELRLKITELNCIQTGLPADVIVMPGSLPLSWDSARKLFPSFMKEISLIQKKDVVQSTTEAKNLRVGYLQTHYPDAWGEFGSSSRNIISLNKRSKLSKNFGNSYLSTNFLYNKCRGISKNMNIKDKMHFITYYNNLKETGENIDSSVLKKYSINEVTNFFNIKKLLYCKDFQRLNTCLEYKTYRNLYNSLNSLKLYIKLDWIKNRINKRNKVYNVKKNYNKYPFFINNTKKNIKKGCNLKTIKYNKCLRNIKDNQYFASCNYNKVYKDYNENIISELSLEESYETDNNFKKNDSDTLYSSPNLRNIYNLSHYEKSNDIYDSNFHSYKTTIFNDAESEIFVSKNDEKMNLVEDRIQYKQSQRNEINNITNRDINLDDELETMSDQKLRVYKPNNIIQINTDDIFDNIPDNTLESPNINHQRKTSIWNYIDDSSSEDEKLPVDRFSVPIVNEKQNNEVTEHSTVRNIPESNFMLYFITRIPVSIAITAPGSCKSLEQTKITGDVVRLYRNGEPLPECLSNLLIALAALRSKHTDLQLPFLIEDNIVHLKLKMGKLLSSNNNSN